jgi:hypothetical protein
VVELEWQVPPLQQPEHSPLAMHAQLPPEQLSPPLHAAAPLDPQRHVPLMQRSAVSPLQPPLQLPQ